MRVDGLTDECKKFLGLGIYNSHMNICFGDGFYLQSLYKKYGKEEVDAEIKRLRKGASNGNSNSYQYNTL